VSLLDGLLRLRGVSWRWREDGTPGAGVIAQEVEAVFPDLVVEVGGMKHVNYGGLVGALIEALRELNQRVVQLEKERR
jgi:hypothetical protein